MKILQLITLCFLASFSTVQLYAQNNGTVYESKTLKSMILNMERNYSVYLPAGYETTDRTYPVVYLFHPAGPGNTIPNHQSWTFYGGLQQYLDKAIENGEIAPMIVVTPDANYESKRISYFNDPEGDFNFEDFFFEEFIPYIESNYRCRTESSSRALAGASLGGAAALQYGIHQPNKFSVIAALSGPIRKYDSQYLKNRYPNVSEDALKQWYGQYDILTYIENLKDNPLKDTKWLVFCGYEDHLSPGNAQLHIELKAKEINHEFRVKNGAHDWTYWRSILPEFFEPISMAFLK